ncbi:MAG TPA: RICIN domain-containing protein [Patescibacteria group bacterium]|nr:RICIN domain-containing protein [Patescibacteria group bacterium]
MKKIKEIFEKLNLKRTLLDLLSIAVVLGILFALIGLQKWAQGVDNNEIDFGKMGPVRIINMGSGKYLSANQSITSGTPTSQFSMDEIHNQVWQIEQQGEGWEIKIVNTNYCLEIDEASRSDGAIAQLWDCVGAPQQLWNIEKLDKGVYELHPSYNNKCLEIGDSSPDEGAAAQQWSCAEVMGQRWEIFSALY